MTQLTQLMFSVYNSSIDVFLIHVKFKIIVKVSLLIHLTICTINMSMNIMSFVVCNVNL